MRSSRVCWSMVVMLGLGLSVGCRDSTRVGKTAKTEQRTFKLRGRIVALDPSGGRITLAHDAIPGYMGAMTMPYKLAAPDTMSEMHVGDVITARVVVDYDAAGPLSPRLDNVVTVGQAKPDTKPAVQYHVPTAGETVPDFHLLNQSGRQIHLSQYRGRVLLLTFIYTRCPVADFCPKMSGNFAEIDKGLAADRAVFSKTHLLSVSFDPRYDTPGVLRSYGGAHTGRFTEEDFSHWEFAAPAEADLAKLEQYFDVGVTTGDPADPSSVMHSLSTVLIGKDGKVLAWYPSNEWKPAEVLEAMRRAAQGSGTDGSAVAVE